MLTNYDLVKLSQEYRLPTETIKGYVGNEETIEMARYKLDCIEDDDLL